MYIYIYIYMYLSLSLSISLSICMYVCMYIYIYIYIGHCQVTRRRRSQNPARDILAEAALPVNDNNQENDNNTNNHIYIYIYVWPFQSRWRKETNVFAAMRMPRGFQEYCQRLLFRHPSTRKEMLSN